MKRLSLCLAVAVTMATLAGCAGSPKSDFYTLSAEASRESVSHGSPVIVVIGAVSVPELVDRPQIVVRAGTNHVTIDEFARWAEPLKSQIPRVFVADLSQLLNSPRVSTLPIGGDAAAAWR
ncbi:PqiC family protein, partial [Paraburkholderia hospita]|uniref:PqiC family protein n=1 Tax=Paraburkholderia hospita TaxID=169430 RepID=UPI000B67D2F6